MASPNPGQILSGLLENSHLGIIAWDSQGRVQVWNRGAERILGWDRKEVLGQPVPAALQLHDIPHGEVELGLSRKGGSVVDAGVWTGAWQDAAGSEQGTIAIITEIGPHREVEEKLAQLERALVSVTAQEKEARAKMQTERRFRELLEAAPDAIIEVDREGRIILLNLATEKSFGYTREELLGKRVEVLIPDSLRPGHIQHRAHYWDHPVTRPMGSGLALRGQRQGRFFVPGRNQPQPREIGGWVPVTAIIRDTSERKQAEDRFRRAPAGLHAGAGVAQSRGGAGQPAQERISGQHEP